jgi:hypothetical protein
MTSRLPSGLPRQLSLDRDRSPLAQPRTMGHPHRPPDPAHVGRTRQPHNRGTVNAVGRCDLRGRRPDRDADLRMFRAPVSRVGPGRIRGRDDRLDHLDSQWRQPV